MSRLTQDGTAEPVSRDQTLRREQRGQGNTHFPSSADHAQDWQPYPIDPYSCYMLCDHTYIHSQLATSSFGSRCRRQSGQTVSGSVDFVRLSVGIAKGPFVFVFSRDFCVFPLLVTTSIVARVA